MENLESTKELIEITHKKHEEKPMTPKKVSNKVKPSVPAQEVDVNLEKEVEKLIANSAYKNPSDGLWYVYDHEKKEWRTQDEDPNGTLESLTTEKPGKEIANASGLLDRSKKINKPEKSQPISEEELVIIKEVLLKLCPLTQFLEKNGET